MDAIEVLSCLMAGCLHDFEHPGVNNAFLVNMCDEKAIRHNDLSVLENHHIAASFNLMLDPKRNWACNFGTAEFKKVRALII
jgi:cGMP-inhibited 3',5'-cyclic phosphodiesterase A